MKLFFSLVPLLVFVLADDHHAASPPLPLARRVLPDPLRLTVKKANPEPALEPKMNKRNDTEEDTAENDASGSTTRPTGVKPGTITDLTNAKPMVPPGFIGRPPTFNRPLINPIVPPILPPVLPPPHVIPPIVHLPPRPPPFVVNPYVPYVIGPHGRPIIRPWLPAFGTLDSIHSDDTPGLYGVWRF